MSKKNLIKINKLDKAALIEIMLMIDANIGLNVNLTKIFNEAIGRNYRFYYD
ncbi:MAG: hypothetical protein V6017_00570 [Candidatus Dasytiphilus stammeri]